MPFKPPSLRSLTILRLWRQRFFRLIGLAWKWLGRLWKPVIASIRRIPKRDQVLALLLLALWIVLLLGNFYFRGVSRFEGSLVTKTMSFIYTGDVDKRFLNSLSLTKLALQGKQPTSLILKGRFSSSDPSMNAQVKSFNQLQVQLSDSASKLILEVPNQVAKGKQLGSIDLKELRILPNAQVEQLTYQPKANQLSFCLQSSKNTNNNCSDIPATPSQTVVGELKFSVNPGEVNLFFANGQIPALNITAATLETSLTWIPEGQEYILEIPASTALEIGLPKIHKTIPEQTIEAVDQLIRGDIPVKQVRFSRLDRSNNVNDAILTSAISDGEVRMMGQSLKLQPQQFLIIPTNRDFDKLNCRMAPEQNPGIQRLRDIRVKLEDPKGLQTLISGESKCLAVGLYQEFPAQTIEPSWLLTYLPQEGINAIYTLIGAFTGILFPRLFPEKDSSK